MFRRSLLAGTVALLSAPAMAASYPDRPLRLIVPYPPGGITDIGARLIAARIQERLGQSVVVENRTGAGGIIGSTAAARSPADGYTIFMGTSATHGSNPSTFANLPYDPVRDFEPIILVASAPLAVVVNPSLPVRSIAELIAYAKANPGKLSFGSTGVGGSVHLTVELFKMLTGTDMLHVPYRGSAPALNDVMAGQLQLMFDNIPSAMPLARGGRLRALAVTSLEPTALVPELPTVARDLPGFESASWVGLFAPKGTPVNVVHAINLAAQAGLKGQADTAAFLAAGLEAKGGAEAMLAAHVASEVAKWAEVAQRAGIVPEVVQ